MSGSLFQATPFHLWRRLAGWGAYKAAIVAIALCGMPLGSPGHAAEYRLAEAGAVLGALVTGTRVDDLRLTVVLDGDQAIASYVYAQIAAASLRQRTNEGYWIPWDGDRDSLIDNRFPVADDRIVFKILDQDIGTDNQGVSLIVAYRTATAFKFGVFGLIPDGSGQ